MFFFFFESEPHIALIGDIKNSKKLEKRGIVQEKLNRVLKEINKNYSKSIASEFLITLGDEFQGLLHSGEFLMEIVQYIKKELYPISIRFGIGIGNISTAIHSEFALGADGPGYYNARSSIESLKMLEKKKEKAISDIRIKIAGENKLQELSLNSIFKLMYSIEESWTEKQRELVNYMIFENSSQTDAAKYYGVTQSNIQQILAKAHYYAYRESFDAINQILGEVKYGN